MVKTQTVEITGKKWKKMRLVAWLMFFGALIVGVAEQAATDGGVAISSSMVLISIALYVCSRVGAWWYHG